MRWCLVVVAAAAALACGGGVDERFTGIWVGTATASGPGGAFSYQARLDMVADGDELHVANVCPDGSGAITANGSGQSISWGGFVVCPIPAASCPTNTLRYSSATIDISESGNAVTVSADALLSGCGSSAHVSVTFSGTKQ